MHTTIQVVQFLQVLMGYVSMKRIKKIVEVVFVKMDNSIQMKIVINIRLVVLLMEYYV